MKITNFRTWATFVACAFLATPAAALPLTINDPGVAGGFWGGAQLGDVTNLTAWGNHLLGLGASATVTADALGDNNAATENYKTGLNNYNATLTGGTAVSGTNNVSAYTWVVAKYGDTRYVLYYVPQLGGTTIPLSSEPIWARESGRGYALMSFVGYNGTTVPVPEGGVTLMLLGAALGCLEAVRRFKKT